MRFEPDMSLASESRARMRMTGGDVPHTLACVGATWPRESFMRYFEALMREAGFEDFAALSRASGVNSTQFSNWKNGVSQPGQANLTKVAPYLNVKPVKLWIAAGLIQPSDLDVEITQELTVQPIEFLQLQALYRDPARTDEDRETIRASLRVTLAGLRALLGADEGNARAARKRAS